MKTTNATVSFRIPKYALKILEIMRQQNTTLSFELNHQEETITLHSELLDFYDYADDVDDIDFFEDIELEGRV